MRCWGAKARNALKNNIKQAGWETSRLTSRSLSGVRVYIFYVTILYIIFYIIYYIIFDIIYYIQYRVSFLKP